MSSAAAQRAQQARSVLRRRWSACTADVKQARERCKAGKDAENGAGVC
jgi:hypothetical protein